MITDNGLNRDKLIAFYHAVAALTLNHDVIMEIAAVSPQKLGDLLEQVDPEWHLFRPNLVTLET